MEKLPHQYHTNAVATPEGPVTISSPDLEDLSSQSPPQFGGPGGYWSPETLLMGALVDCFTLTWRAVAAHNKFEWTELSVSATGVLDRVERATQFTQATLSARLTVPAGTDAATAERLLHKSETGCLITASLKAEVSLATEIVEV